MKFLKPLLILLLLAGAVVYSTVDRAPDPAFTAFIAADNPARPEDNGYLTMLGLTVPANVDAHAYGAKIMQDFSGWWPSHRPGLSYWLTRNGLASDEATNKIEQGLFHPASAGPALRLTPFPGGLDHRALDCWLMPRVAWQDHLKNFPAQKACLTRDQLATYLDQNKIILNRYIAMLGAPRFYEPFGIGMIRQEPSDLITLNSLFVASLVSNARDGYAAESLHQWLAMQAALDRTAADQQQAIMKTAATVTPLQSLQAITESASGLITANQAEILAVLLPPAFGPGGLDMAALLRADYNGRLRPIDDSLTWPIKLAYKPNLTRSHMATCTRMAIAATAQPLPQILPALKKEIARSETRQGLQTQMQAFTNYLGFLDASRCPQSTIIETRLKMLRAQKLNAAWTTAMASGIAPDAMPAWLKATPAQLHDPLTGAPFAWDAARNTVHAALPSADIAVFYPAPLPVIEMAPVTLVPPPPPQ